MAFFWKKSIAVVILLTLSSNVLSQQNDVGTLFQCGVPDDANIEKIDNGEVDITTIETQYKFKWKDSDTILMPQTIYYHIYAVPNDQELGFSCYPPGLVEPRISGSTLDFPADISLLKNLGYSKGDRVEAAVNLYVPVSQLKDIYMGGVNEVVEVIVTEDLLGNITNYKNATTTTNMADDLLPTLTIRSNGVNSQVYVDAPYSRIRLIASGIDNQAILVAGANSTVDLSGVHSKVYLKSERVQNVQLSGVDQFLMIEGDYDQIKMTGVNGMIQVNGGSGCNAIDSSGVDNNCRVTNDTVKLTTLDCLATSEVVKGCGSNWCASSLSTGAWIGIGIAILVGMALCIGLCFYGCRGRRGSNDPGANAAVPPPQQRQQETHSPDPYQEQVVEAEVLEIQDRDDVEQALPQVGAKVYKKQQLVQTQQRRNVERLQMAMDERPDSTL